MMMKELLAVGLALGLALGLVACGGDSSDKSLPDTRPTGSAEGKAQHGPIRNATISAYLWEGSRGEFLAQTKTDEEGLYTLELSVPTSDLILVSSGGNYLEEATGRDISMGAGDSLKAAIRYNQGKSSPVQLTYFTTLAACRAEYLVENGLNTGNAITQANNELSAIIGESITGVEPVDVTKTDAFTPYMTPAHRYGIAVAAVSLAVDNIRRNNQALESNDTYTVKYFTNLGCKDILNDGILDGISEGSQGNPSGQLYLGNTPITTETYRKLLALSVIEFGSHKNNRTGLDTDNLLEMANGISKSASSLFGGIEGEPVDSAPPTITINVAQNTLFAGSVEIELDVQDPLGVDTIDVYLDGVFFTQVQADNQVLQINTASFADGDHDVVIIATDILGNTSAPLEEAQTFTFQFINTGPGVSLSSPTLINSTSYAATGSFVLNGADVRAILVNGIEATINTENATFEAIVEVNGGVNEVQAVITDSLGNSTETTHLVKVDLIPPTLSIWDTNVTFTLYDGHLNRCEYGYLGRNNGANRPVCLSTENTSLNGLPVSWDLSNDGYIMVGAEIVDLQGDGIFSDIRNIKAEYRYKKGDVEFTEWAIVQRENPDDRVVVVPFATEFLGDDFYQVDRDTVHTIEIKITDEAGNAVYETYRVRLDVLTPALKVSTIEKSAALFAASFANRQALNLQTYEVEYAYNNYSSIPYLITVSPQNGHSASQSFEGSIRKNQVYEVADGLFESWEVIPQTYESIIETRQAGEYKRNWPSVQTLFRYNDGAFSAVSAGERTKPAVFIQSDGYTPSSSKETDIPNLDCTSSGLLTSGGFYETVQTYNDYFSDPTINTSNYCMRYVTNPKYFYYQVRTSYTYSKYRTVTGYPRNELSAYSQTYNINDSAIQIIDKTRGIEIFPVNGWYRIPPTTNVSIHSRTTLPFIENKMDARVESNTNTVPYGSEIYQDKSITWNMNTDIKIGRAIDPGGDITAFSALTKTETLEGLGIKSYTLSR